MFVEMISGVLLRYSVFLMLAYSAHLLVGMLRMFTLGQAGIFMLAAYTVGCCQVVLGWSLPSAIICAITICSLLGAFQGYFATKLNGDRYALFTFAVAESLRHFIIQFESFTGGASSLVGITYPDWLSKTYPLASLVLISSGVCVLIFFLLYRFEQTPAGLMVRVQGLENRVSMGLGANPTLISILTHIGAAIMVVPAGVIFALLMRTLNPTWFTLNESVLVLLCIIIGGIGSLLGVVLGTLIVIILPEVLPFSELATLVVFVLESTGLSNNVEVITAPLKHIFIGMMFLLAVFYSEYRRRKLAKYSGINDD